MAKHRENAVCSEASNCRKGDCPHRKPHYTWGMACNKYRWCLEIGKSVICK